jgi:two-component system chemotaxis sensor kinase CheA
MSDFLDPNNEELLKDFFNEAQLMVEMLEQNILVLENDPSNSEAIDEIFRAAHTLKGSAATVQMQELAAFTHHVEDALDEIRSGNVKVDGGLTDILLSSIDVIKNMLDARLNGTIYDDDITELTASLNAFMPGNKAKAPAPKAQPVKQTAKAKSSGTAKSTGGLSEYEILELKQAASAGEKIYLVSVKLDESNPMNTVSAIQVFAALKDAGKVLKTNPDFELLYEDKFYPLVEYFIASSSVPAKIKEKINFSDVVESCEITEITDADSIAEEKQTPVKEAVPSAKTAPAALIKDTDTFKAVEDEINSAAFEADEQEFRSGQLKPEIKKKEIKSSVLRVDSKRIDNLLNLVSETIIDKAAFNQINIEFSDIQNELMVSENVYRQRIKELFDSLPDYMDEIQSGKDIKKIRKEILERFGDIFNIFNTFESKFKSTVSKFRSTSQDFSRIVSDLNEGVMQIRMVPISQIFSRFPRLVRDLSKSLNKKINLVIEGEDTELDKSVIEDLLDPLIHCVRNSIDHGIESQEDRAAAGKPEDGTVLLKASNEGNMIIIEVMDDGKGIDIEKVREKAISKGLIHPSKALSDVECYNLIFEPGFSTAKQVTDLSGRGVGLDVVKKQIEKLNGTVSVWSERGAGSRFTIKLPLTLAIIQGLLVRVGQEIYAIPITSVLDSHRIKPSDVKFIDNYEVFNVREDVVSLLRMNRLFNIQTEEKKDYYFVVIVGSNDKKVGLVVDSLIGEEDVVIKPLKDRYTNSPGTAGATILGDGTVSLIIDVSQLLDLGVKTEREQRLKRETTIF